MLFSFVSTAKCVGFAETTYFCLFSSTLCRLAINEDPVTGSAHCALCPYWAERASTLDINNEVLIGRQASPRGGSVTVALRGDRVLLSGTAVTTMKSKVFV